MTTAALNSPITTLRQAIGKTFPDRAETVNVPFEGSLSQAWQAFARLLATTPLELAKAVAGYYRVSAAGPLDKFTPDALALIPSSYCQQNSILPLWVDDSNTLVVATANPLDDNLTERTRFLANKPIRWVLAPPAEIEDAIVFAYAKEATRLSIDGDAISQAVQAELDENAVVKLGRALMVNAIEQRASDLHIQPYMGAFVARAHPS